MDINLTISAAPAITDKIAIRIYKSTAPNVVVAMEEFDAPHSSPRNVTFDNLDPTVYIVNTYETVGDPVIGTLRHSFIYDPTFQSADIKASEFLKMVGGTAEYTDATWAGYTIDVVFRGASGPMFVPDQINWVLNVDSEVIGFQLSQVGDTFAPDEQVTVTFLPKIVTVSPVVVSNKFITGEDTITVDTVLTDANVGRLQRLQGAAEAFTVSLPAIGTIDPFSLFVFSSDGGSHVNVTIDIDGAGSINFFGNRTDLHLAQGERAWILYTGTDYVVLNDVPGVLRVGEIVDQYDKDATVQGCVFADGELLDRTVYRRLWEFVNQLDGSMLITKAAWDASTAQQNRYNTGDGVTTFGLPKLFVDGYARGVDGLTRLAASHQDDAILTHKHETDIYTAPAGSKFGNGTTSRTNMGTFFSLLTGFAALTNTPVNDADVSVAGAENLTNNFGVYKLIRI